MFPSASIYDECKHGVANTKLSSYGQMITTTFVAHRANFQNLTGREFRPTILGTSERSPLYRHIMQIIFLGSFKQVCRVTAARVIARMADVKTRPTLTSEKVRNAMGIGTAILSAKLTITRLRYRFQPSPTITSWALAGRPVNITPETSNLLFGKNGRVSINSNHRENLQHRFELWLGSFGCLEHSFGPLYCTTRSV
jgi:hypothetical protein